MGLAKTSCSHRATASSGRQEVVTSKRSPWRCRPTRVKDRCRPTSRCWLRAREGSGGAAREGLAGGWEGVLGAARLGNWENAAFSIRRMQAAWKKLRVGHQPPRIAHRLSATLAALTKSVRARERRQAKQDAIDVSQPILDLQLQYRPPAAIDASRFHLWTQQLRVDAAAGDPAGRHGGRAGLGGI